MYNKKNTKTLSYHVLQRNKGKKANGKGQKLCLWLGRDMWDSWWPSQCQAGATFTLFLPLDPKQKHNFCSPDTKIIEILLVEAGLKRKK